MFALTEFLILGIYLFLLIIGNIFEKLRLPALLIFLVASGLYLIQEDISVRMYLFSEEGKHLLVLLLSVVLGLTVKRLSLHEFFNFSLITCPLAFALLITDHVLLNFFLMMGIFFYVLSRCFNLSLTSYKSHMSNLGLLALIATLFATTTTIGFTSDFFGMGFVRFEFAAIVAAIFCMSLYFGMIYFFTESSLFDDKNLSSDLVVIAPALIFKTVIILQSQRVLLPVGVQEFVYNTSLWVIAALLIILGLASFYKKTLDELSLSFFLSHGLIVFLALFIEPSTELYLPLYLIVMISFFIRVFCLSNDLGHWSYRHKWISLCLCYTPLSALPFSLIIYLRVLLTDGLELVSLFIFISLTLLISSGISLFLHAKQNQTFKKALKLPIRTIFLFSCTLLSTCLLVI